jgi:hypothetical protein
MNMRGTRSVNNDEDIDTHCLTKNRITTAFGEAMQVLDFPPCCSDALLWHSF